MKQRTKGFTLIEVLVVITLIAILLAIVLANISGTKTKSRDNVRIANIQTIRLALEEYRASCGVFPYSLAPTTRNGKANSSGSSECSKSFGDIMKHLPILPERSTPSVLEETLIVSPASMYNNYFYSGLSKEPGGPCYDYHLGVELEFAEDNDQPSSKYLDEDHDFIRFQPPYTRACSSSSTDFGGTNAAIADQKGLYDFRSAKRSD